MTNSSPENPQPSEPSTITQEELTRIRRQVRKRASEEIMEEWIAVLVAFGAIGAILFWSLGGTKSNFTSLSRGSFLSSSRQTTDTKANQNLDTQLSSGAESFNDLNIADSSDDTQSEVILDSDRSSLSTNNINQKNPSFNRVPPVVSPLATSAAISQPVSEAEITELETEAEVEITELETEPEAEITELETEAEVEITELESEPEVVATEAESESAVDDLEIAFSDVTEQYWAYPFISKLATENLIPDSESFEPDAPITRAGMASLISYAFKNNPEIKATKRFKDVAINNGDEVTDINKAVAMGFMNGYSEGNFSPEQNIPRYQVLVALATGLNLEPSKDSETILQNFTDSENLPPWSLDKVAAATEAGIAINRPDFDLTSLNPNEPATRAEAAAMIYQALANLGTVPPIESQYKVPTP